ncbi:MAG: CIA30 family protein [Phycisphaerales bacterium]
MHAYVFFASVFALCSIAFAQPANIEFKNGVAGWRTVLDGVMGGRSTGRVTQPEDGILRFSGELSLENNGGFSQTQTTVPAASFKGATGIEARVRGDGRTYQFDVRCSDVRMMAGSFQTKFETVAGEWVTLTLPFEDFRLYSFGRPVPDAPELVPARVESIGVTLADKKSGAFQLDIDFIRAIGGAEAAPAGGSDLVTVAKREGLNTLLALVGASGLQLPADDRVTVFAPTDKAFEAVPAETVKFLTSEEGRATLQAILKHHVLPMAVDSGSLLQRRGVLALSGQNLAVDGDALTIAGAALLKTDVPFDGGVLYVIDRVLMPETRSIADIVGEDPRLATLLKAVTAAGIGGLLGSENAGPWTVLAPSNEAFAALGEEKIKALLADPEALAAVLSAHVIPSRIARRDMLSQQSARTLPGRDAVAFELVDGKLTVGGAGIVAADIQASNGLIHIIDRVLEPGHSGSQGASVSMSKVSPQSVASLIELAIERGAPIFNDGNPEACAAIYEVTIAAIVDLAAGAAGGEGTEALRLALAEGQTEKDGTKRAWIFRRAMDRVYRETSRGGER